jgi:hypothetical protein
MPNWCQNEVYVSTLSDDVEAQEEYKNFRETCFTQPEGKLEFLDFEKILPVPEDEDNYYWCIANWGTKWDAADFNLVDEGDDWVSMRFDTAWSPPEGIYEVLTTKYEHLNFNWFYKEEGVQIAGWLPTG